MEPKYYDHSDFLKILTREMDDGVTRLFRLGYNEDIHFEFLKKDPSKKEGVEPAEKEFLDNLVLL